MVTFNKKNITVFTMCNYEYFSHILLVTVREREHVMLPKIWKLIHCLTCNKSEI